MTRGTQGIVELAQRSKPTEFDSLRGLDLERDDTTVVPFDDEVHLVVVAGPPMADAGDPVEPGRLFRQLPHDERLQKMAEFGEGRRVSAGELVGGETQQPRRHARVHHMDLRTRSRS